VVSLGIFSVATDGTMCPGDDSASKNEYQDPAGGKDGRCVRVTFIPPSWCRKSRRSRGLSLLEPQGPAQACSGKTLPLPLLCVNCFRCVLGCDFKVSLTDLYEKYVTVILQGGLHYIRF
jgi:hypothetical protein